MDIIYREYVAGSGSMTIDLYDSTEVLRRKYRSIIERVTKPIPPQPMKIKAGTRGLAELLSACTNEKLSEIAELVKTRFISNAKKSVRVAGLVQPLSVLFGELMDHADSTILAFLSRFSTSPTLRLPSATSMLPQIRYLLQRGLLFFSVEKGETEAILVLPTEFLTRVREADLPVNQERTRRNEAVCAIGTGILCHYGLVGEPAFYEMLGKLVALYRKNKITVRVSVGHVAQTSHEFERGHTWLGESWKGGKTPHYTSRSDIGRISEESPSPKDSETLTDHDLKVIRLFADTSERIRHLQFMSPPLGHFFCHGQVYDPYHIHDAQFRAREPGFRPLSCNDVLNSSQMDIVPMRNMDQYLMRKMRMNPMKAQWLVAEWAAHIRNGEPSALAVQCIIMQLDAKDQAQLNDLMNQASVYFLNDLHHWDLRGRTTAEVDQYNESLEDNWLEETDPAMESARMAFHPGAFESPDDRLAKSASPGTIRLEVRPGRNEPCPCGSGKKYKKCCGLSTTTEGGQDATG